MGESNQLCNFQASRLIYTYSVLQRFYVVVEFCSGHRKGVSALQYDESGTRLVSGSKVALQINLDA